MIAALLDLYGIDIPPVKKPLSKQELLNIVNVEKRACNAATAKRRLLEQYAIARELIETFYSRGCLLCNESERCCMNAHHVDKKMKSFEIGKVSKVSGGYRMLDEHTVDDVESELKKCVCLCANCHKKVHSNIIKVN